MNIEISGVFPANRGALLMLEAIREQIAAAFPDARLAVPLDWSAADRLRNGVWATSGSVGRSPAVRLLEYAPWHVREATTYLPARRIDVLLDASGFGYGDFWGEEKLRRRLTDRLESWRNEERRAVLLPQALGPFTEPGMADAFRRACERLDLVFVRDDRSMGYVTDVLPDTRRVRRAPDFTNLLKPTLPERLEKHRGAALLIPNEKMVAGKSEERFAAYVDFLEHATRAIERSGREPTLLLHEGSRDVRIADALGERLGRPLTTVDEPSALVTKAVVGAAELVVSSRFHGLVSALSAAVPSLACGWSHKYRELMADYGCPDMVVDLDRPAEFEDHFARLLSRADDEAFREQLKAKGEAQKERSTAIWGEVLDLLRARS